MSFSKHKVLSDIKAEAFLASCLRPENQANEDIVFACMPELGRVLRRLGMDRGQTGLPLLFAFLPLSKACSLTSFTLINNDFHIYNNVNHVMFASPGTVKSPTLTTVERVVGVRIFECGVLCPINESNSTHHFY
jgi:hypothetical protein